jgi:pimeloyl-ACP methyl ester carboxylesterase
VLVNPVAEPMSFLDPVAHALGLSRARRDGMAERIRIRAGGDLSRIDPVRAIRGSNVPGLVIHDRNDGTVPWRQGRALADAWPVARFVSTSGLDHRGALRSPEVLATITDFVAGLGDVAPASPEPVAAIRAVRVDAPVR